VSTETRITITIDSAMLRSYADEFLATAWHLAQANPAPHGDHAAGDLAAKLGSEIIRRWLRGVEPALWHHQGSDYYWQQLRTFAKYVPPPGANGASANFHDGRWVARRPDDEPD